MKHQKYLDGWRGLAISGVLLSHFAGLQFVNSGRLGVDLFFVLSGLLMSRILFEDKCSLSTFYRRRISRIVPVFALFLLVLFVSFAMAGIVVSFQEVLASVTFTRTFFGETRIWDSQFPIGHLWSLNVEEHSYVALSLIALLPWKKVYQGWLLIIIAALCWFAIAWCWKHPDIAPKDYMIRTECAALALLLSAGYAQIKHLFERFVQAWMAPLAFLFGCACYTEAAPDQLQPYVAPFLLAFAINHIGNSYAWVVKTLELKWLRMVGIWSFSIYLWQQPFTIWAENGQMNVALAFVSAMTLGLTSYYFYESPIRTWLNQHWGPKVVAPIAVKP